MNLYKVLSKSIQKRPQSFTLQFFANRLAHADATDAEDGTDDSIFDNQLITNLSSMSTEEVTVFLQSFLTSLSDKYEFETRENLETIADRKPLGKKKPTSKVKSAFIRSFIPKVLKIKDPVIRAICLLLVFTHERYSKIPAPLVSDIEKSFKIDKTTDSAFLDLDTPFFEPFLLNFSKSNLLDMACLTIIKTSSAFLMHRFKISGTARQIHDLAQRVTKVELNPSLTSFCKDIFMTNEKYIPMLLIPESAAQNTAAPSNTLCIVDEMVADALLDNDSNQFIERLFPGLKPLYISTKFKQLFTKRLHNWLCSKQGSPLQRSQFFFLTMEINFDILEQTAEIQQERWETLSQISSTGIVPAEDHEDYEKVCKFIKTGNLTKDRVAYTLLPINKLLLEYLSDTTLVGNQVDLLEMRLDSFLRRFTPLNLRVLSKVLHHCCKNIQNESVKQCLIAVLNVHIKALSNKQLSSNDLVKQYFFLEGCRTMGCDMTEKQPLYEDIFTKFLPISTDRDVCASVGEMVRALLSFCPDKDDGQKAAKLVNYLEQVAALNDMQVTIHMFVALSLVNNLSTLKNVKHIKNAVFKAFITHKKSIAISQNKKEIQLVVNILFKCLRIDLKLAKV